MAKKFSIKKQGLGDVLMKSVLNVGGGVLANVADSKLLSTQSDTTKALIYAGVGVAAKAFMPNPIVNPVAEGLLGVAGYKLGTTLGVSGIFGTPTQSTIGAASSWIAERANVMSGAPTQSTVSGTVM